MHLSFRALVVATIASSACSFCAWADPSVLSLDDAIKATLQSNPQLVGYEYRAKALAGERQAAALKPQLRLSAELDNIAGSGEYQGAAAGEFSLSLSSVIELGEQRYARLGLVTARQQQLDSRQRLLTLDLLTQVARQFVALAAAQEQLLLLQQTRQFAQDNSAALGRQVQAGRTPEAELLRAKAALARVDIDIQKTRQQWGSDAIKLSAYWAQSHPSFTRVSADLFALPSAVPIAELMARLDGNPDLAVLGDEVYLRAAEVRQVQAAGKTSLEWSAGVRRLQASDDSALLLGVTLPLGAAGRAAPALATASAQQAGAEQEQQSLRMQLRAQLLSLHSAYEQALAEVSALRTQVVPPLKQALSATAEAFNQGRYSYLELNLAQRELLETQLLLLDAAVRAHLLAADIERLTGSALGGAPGSSFAGKKLP